MKGRNFIVKNKQYVRVAVVIIALLVVVGGAAAVYIWITGSNIPSGPLNPPPLDSDASQETRTLLHIVPEESTVRFLIDEELFGQPNTVIGETNQVAGDLLIDFANPSNSEVGTILINMRTIATDNEFRNRALRSQILLTSEYEFSEFATSELTGLPEAVTMGQAFSFQIVGTLTVRGIDRETTFDVTVTPINETRIEGHATTQVLYTDFDMQIPNAPGVANVAEEVTLEIDFVAAGDGDTAAAAESTPAP
jgi:polyisoprenoid-binding protein YceI